MNEFKRNILRTLLEDEIIPISGYCVTWEAHNNSNINMSLLGFVDFTEILAGRTIADTPVSNGEVTGYYIAGDPMTLIPCSIIMTFTSTKANFSGTLPAPTDTVLTSIVFSVAITCTNADDLDPLEDIRLDAAVTSPPQLDSEYNSCG